MPIFQNDLLNHWVHAGFTFDNTRNSRMLHHLKRKVQDKYRAYVELGIDEELKPFNGKGNIMPYLGSDEFRSWAYEQRVTNDNDVSEHEKSLFRPDMQVIIERVAQIFDVLPDSMLNSVRGRRNLPRWVALYLCPIEGHR